MGFKVNTSFLRFLTMGAVGVHSTIEYLRQRGFEPIELERYCGSNKIWMTKVKRLRLPDLLCVRTGLRFEVRAKSTLKVRMSDAPNNADRRWDAGLRDDDVVAFVACNQDGEEIAVFGSPVFFQVGDLRASLDTTKLGPPKSAAEGAERDREWRSTVPLQDGEILEVTPDRIITALASGRRQTYKLSGKVAYVQAGDHFVGSASIIAGAVPRLAPLAAARTRTWEPLENLLAPNAVDRYAAAKATPHRVAKAADAQTVLLAAVERETDDRVALEMAASAAILGSDVGLERIVATVWNHDRTDLRMEAVLILTEIGNAMAARELKRVATSEGFKGEELRQAATWGMGKAGCKAYEQLVDLLGDGDDAVALHAIAAFGPDVPEDVVRSLVGVLQGNDARSRAAASEALRLIGSEAVLRSLVAAAQEWTAPNPWVLATLGRLEPATVRAALADHPLLAAVEPVLALGPGENWVTSSEVAEDLHFLLQQNVG